MMRLLLLGLVGYAAYRVARNFVDSVPDDFEPVGLIPSPSPRVVPASRRASQGPRQGARPVD
jgi:hypothetical protein